MLDDVMQQQRRHAVSNVNHAAQLLLKVGRLRQLFASHVSTLTGDYRYLAEGLVASDVAIHWTKRTSSALGASVCWLTSAPLFC